MVALLSTETALVQALLLDSGYLSDERTDADVAAIFGAGAQARWQLRALTLARPIREARI
jgi:ornithine cyclodeaminase